MDKTQALAALKEGKTLTHNYFSGDEWMKQVADDIYKFEDGILCDLAEFWKYRQDPAWQTGWHEVESPEDLTPDAT